MKRPGLAALLVGMALFFSLGASSCGTVQPVPSPSPDAAVVDKFSGHLYDCHGQALDTRQVVMDAVYDCLNAEGVDVQIANLPWEERFVACAVRDTGSAQNSSCLAAGNTGIACTVASRARKWVCDRNLGFK
jgi:hypothetical protein